MATFQTQTFDGAPTVSLGERLNMIGAKVSGLVLVAYGVAVLVEVARAYFLI